MNANRSNIKWMKTRRCVLSPPSHRTSQYRLKPQVLRSINFEPLFCIERLQGLPCCR